MQQSQLALADSLAGASFSQSPKSSGKLTYPIYAEETKYNFQPYLVVFGGLLIHLCIGGQYMTVNLLPYISSFLATQDGNTTRRYNHYSDLCTWIYPLQAIGQCVSMSYGGKLENKIGPKYTVLIGGSILCIGVLLTTWTCRNFYLLLITYSMMHGIGIGFIYSSPLVCSMKWFPNHKGFVNGIILSGAGISPIIFTQIMTQLINPNNISLDPKYGFLNQDTLLKNVSSFFWKLSLIYACGILIGVAALQNPRLDKLIKLSDDLNESQNSFSVISLSAYIDSEKKAKEYTSLIKEENKNNKRYPLMSLKRKLTAFYLNYSLSVIKQCKFWNLFFTFLFAAIMLIFVDSQWKILTNKHLKIKNDFMLSVMADIGSVFNAAGRIVFGKMFDCTQSYRFSMGLIMFMVTLLVATWPLIGFDNDIKIGLGFVWICAMFLFYNGLFSILPSYIAHIWGTTKTGVILGYIFLSGIPANIITAQLIIWIKNA
eukprot:399612_1